MTELRIWLALALLVGALVYLSVMLGDRRWKRRSGWRSEAEDPRDDSQSHHGTEA